MRKKYTEHEREIRERERVERSKNHEIRRQEKQTENDGKLEFLILYWITSVVIKYVLPPFLKLFFKLIHNLIKSLIRKTFNFARLIFNFIFRPLSKKDSLLILRLISFFFRLNLIFFTFFIIGAIILALTLV